jgi:hypothetical protein
MLKRLFGPERERVSGGWRELHIEGVCNCSLHQILLGGSDKEDGNAYER